MSHTHSIDWEKGNGLVPAIVQDSKTGQVLMLGYMNQESFDKTKASGHVHFFSRSRNHLWEKGETSGNYLELVQMSLDCDNDTVLILARPLGPTCHLGRDSCFDLKEEPGFLFLSQLEKLIAQRAEELPEGSYTTTLFQKGIKRMAQKVGEEGVESALAAVQGTDEELVAESADLIFHLLVMLRARGLSLEPVVSELQHRHMRRDNPE